MRRRETHSPCKDTCRFRPKSASVLRALFCPSPALRRRAPPGGATNQRTGSATPWPLPAARRCAGFATSIPSCLRGEPASSNSNVQGGRDSYFFNPACGCGAHDCFGHGDAVDHLIGWYRVGRAAARCLGKGLQGGAGDVEPLGLPSFRRSFDGLEFTSPEQPRATLLGGGAGHMGHAFEPDPTF